MGVWDWDIVSGRIKWSDNLEAVFGLTPGGFEGTLEAFKERIHPEDVEAVLREITRNVEEGTQHDTEFRHIWPDGSVHWITGQGRVFRDANGRAVRMVGVAMDITARKDLEEQLRQSQKMEAIGRLADEVAHDFGNLLTVILSYSHELLGDTKPGDPMHQSLAEIV